MPFYDRACANGHRQLDVFETVHCLAPACLICGAATERIFIGKPANVIGDECEILQENGFRHPRRFTSKIERRRALKEAGLSEMVRHVPAPGSDRSKHTTNWAATIGSKTLENAKALVERPSTFTGNDTEPPVRMRITFVQGEGRG